MPESEIILHKDRKVKQSPREMIFKYIIYLPLFIFSIGVCLTVAYIYLRYQIPYYSSSINLLIKDDKGSRGGGNTDALDELILFKSKVNLANELEVLKSATLMEKVVRELNLNTQYIVEGNLKRTETYNSNRFVTFEPVANVDSNAGFYLVLKFNKNKNFQIEGIPDKTWYKPGDIVHNWMGDFRIRLENKDRINPDYKYIIFRQRPFDCASGLASGLYIRQLNQQANILKITITSEIPQKGIDILNGLVRAYNLNSVENKNRVIDNTVRFIDGRLELLTLELGKVELGLQEFRQEHEIVDLPTQGTAEYGKTQTVEAELGQQEVKLALIRMVDNFVNNPANKYKIVPALDINDPTLSSLVSQYNSLLIEREEKLRGYKPDNPLWKQKEDQIEGVRVSIAENLRTLRKSVTPARNKLLTDYRKAKGQVKQVPAKARAMLEISRQQGIKEKLYLFLLQKREESAIAIASSTSNSYSIDPANSYWLPISPDRGGTYRMALIIGILLPLGFIYIRDVLNDKVTSRNDITKATDMPIVGEITHHKMASREVVIGIKDRSIIAEQFRMTRTNLNFFIASKKSPVVLVTSSMAGEGKTFTSMNLGAVWAVSNKKTVILELDLRKPKISKALNLTGKKGISNYVIGDAVKEELPVPVEGTSNLFIVPAGPIPPNPSELLLETKVEELFTYLREHFDIIIIDSAPLGLVSDAKVLSRYADCIVYVVRQRYTPKKQMEFINELYSSKTFNNISLLVNDVKMSGYNSYYGYGYGYGYGYNYGSYGGYGFTYSLPYGYGEGERKKPGLLKKMFGFFK